MFIIYKGVIPSEDEGQNEAGDLGYFPATQYCYSTDNSGIGYLNGNQLLHFHKLKLHIIHMQLI